MTAPILEAREVTKRFQHVQALQGVSLKVNPAEVVALVGDNGAGKSTLIKILSGVFPPDGGEIRVDGRSMRFGSPADARRAGIETLFQDLALVPTLDVTANLYLGRELLRGPRWLGVLDHRAMRAAANDQLAALEIGAHFTGQRVDRLSGGQRQAVGVARSVAWGHRLVIMDEPTAALGVRESRRVLTLIKDLRAAGRSVIVISHNLEHVFEVADRVLALRVGRVAGEGPTSGLSKQEVVHWMSGL